MLRHQLIGYVERYCIRKILSMNLSLENRPQYLTCIDLLYFIYWFDFMCIIFDYTCDYTFPGTNFEIGIHQMQTSNVPSSNANKSRYVESANEFMFVSFSRVLILSVMLRKRTNKRTSSHAIWKQSKLDPISPSHGAIWAACSMPKAKSGWPSIISKRPSHWIPTFWTPTSTWAMCWRRRAYSIGKLDEFVFDLGCVCFHNCVQHKRRNVSSVSHMGLINGYETRLGQQNTWFVNKEYWHSLGEQIRMRVLCFET